MKTSIGRILFFLSIVLTASIVQAGDLEVVGYFHGRDFDPEKPQYSVDNAAFDCLSDAILLTLPHVDNIQPDSDSESIANFIKRTENKPLRRWFSNDFSGEGIGRIMADPEKKQKHYAAVLEFLERHGFDGLNVDWEYPANQEEWLIYSTYLTELGKLLHSKQKLISIAAAGWGIGLTPEAIEILDQVQIMSYDMAGDNDDNDHSSLADSEAYVIYFLEKGFRPEQLRMGVPFYGLHRTRRSEFHPIFRYHDGLESSYRTFVLHGGRDLANTDMFDGHHYNGFPKLAKKVELAKKYKIGGLMIWELGFDLPPSDPASLLRRLVSDANSVLAKNLPPENAVDFPWPGGLHREIYLTDEPDLTAKPDYSSYAYALQSVDAPSPKFYQQFHGFLCPAVSGEYPIRIQGKGVQLTIADNFMLETKENNFAAGKVYLKAGVQYKIELIHRCGDTAAATFRVEWQSPDGATELIGPHVLRPEKKTNEK